MAETPASATETAVILQTSRRAHEGLRGLLDRLLSSKVPGEKKQRGLNFSQMNMRKENGI